MTSLLGPLAAGSPLDHVLPHELFRVGPVHVTNQLLMLVVAAVLMLLIFPLAARGGSLVPRGFRNFVEGILVYLREQVARPVLHEATDRYVPFLWTIFFLILLANLIGLLPVDPLVTAITGRPSHFGGTATGNVMITLGLAACAFLVIHVGGVIEHGPRYFKMAFVPHVPWPMLVLLVPIEILGAVVKPFALCIRLFANMIAGHIVLAVLIGFTSVLASGVSGTGIVATVAAVAGATFISLLEIFVAFLQAYIFTFLTTLFLGMAVHPEH